VEDKLMWRRKAKNLRAMLSPRSNLLTVPGLCVVLLFLHLILIAQETGTLADLNNTLTPAACREDLQVLGASFEEGHAGYNRYVSEEYLHNLFMLAELKCNVPRQKWEFFRMVSTISASIKDGHTRVRFPDLLEKSIDDRLELLPFFVMVDGDEAVIYRDLGNSPGKFAGMRLRSVNRITIPLILEQLREATSVEGDIRSAKDRRIEGWAFIRGLSTTLGINSPYTIDLIDSRGKVFTQKLEGINFHSLDSRLKIQEGNPHRLPPNLLFTITDQLRFLRSGNLADRLTRRRQKISPRFSRQPLKRSVEVKRGP
jgi:hypothetical protein